MVAAFRDCLLENARSAGLELGGSELVAFESHYRLLQEWGRRMNLTGLTDEEGIIRKHFLEPIAAADLLENIGSLVDLGSGNGFPAIPLKVLRRGLDLTLVEASEKKSAFLWAVLRELGIKGARVETRRVRGLADLADILPCRYLTLRAIKPAQVLRGPGPAILIPGGKALYFTTRRLAGSPGDRPIPGLRLETVRPLPSGTGSVVAVFVP